MPLTLTFSDDEARVLRWVMAHGSIDSVSMPSTFELYSAHQPSARSTGRPAPPSWATPPSKHAATSGTPSATNSLAMPQPRRSPRPPPAEMGLRRTQVPRRLQARSAVSLLPRHHLICGSDLSLTCTQAQLRKLPLPARRLRSPTRRTPRSILRRPRLEVMTRNQMRSRTSPRPKMAVSMMSSIERMDAKIFGLQRTAHRWKYRRDFWRGEMTVQAWEI